MPDSSRRTVVVTGDVTMDWNLASIEQNGADPWGAKSRSPAWETDETTRARQQPGGVALLGKLMKEIGEPLGWTVHEVGEVVEDGGRRFRQSYAVWSPFSHTRGSGGHEPKIWRVQKFLGLDQRGEKEQDREAASAVAEWNQSIDAVAADLVILDDADLSFRTDESLWPRVVREAENEKQAHFVIKMARPVAQGQLFERLVETCPDRVTVVTRINDLRQSAVRVSRELSWERTAEDLVWELTYNPSVHALARCAHVVIAIETGGALLLSSRTGEDGAARQSRVGTLFYDPRAIEGQWAQQHPGGMMGSTSCLAAGIARQLLLDPEHLGDGIQRAIAAMRALHADGWGEGPADDPEFPTEKIATILAGDQKPLTEIEVPGPPVGSLLRSDSVAESPIPGSWTILEQLCRDRPVLARAVKVAENGIKAELEGVPVGQFGKLETVDRKEIEGLGSIRALIQEYKRQNETRPLSIAVFGPPGSGKSFGVKQVAQSLLGDEVKELTFNLSQLNEPSELYGALHQVRDACLKGLLPLVFWDEFDSTLDGAKLGWLRHFLVPMQDGTFQQGEITHPIGNAIFVFAGGIYETMERFRSPTEKELEDFKKAKARDFLSRLRGYVDIVGPDPRENDADKDPYFRIRRAILLRSILRNHRPHLFRKEKGMEEPVLQIDRGVLRAFLETRFYRHGVRSLESIVAMSTLSGKTQFERSSLPEDAQLDLHVDANDFLAWVQGPDVLVEIKLPEREEDRDELERFAESVHVVYCEKLLTDEYTWFAPTDDYLKQYAVLRPFVEVMADRRAAAVKEPKAALVAYEDLSEDRKELNRDFARDIRHKLATVGYFMRPARTDDRVIGWFSGDEVEFLAEQEHERWMRQKLEQEPPWRWGPEDDDEKRETPSLVPWRPLSPEQKVERYGAYAERVGDGVLSDEVKDWDRFLVRSIPRILAVAGYTIVKHTGEDGGPS